jgi:glutamine---fructose-6-phosphate transaminase (isomerizing)
MCGIAGCVGHENAVKFVTSGLDFMEERGYDSAGVAYSNGESPRLEVIREVGSVANLLVKIPESAAEATAAIGHTRWATHGEVSVRNAHPQVNSDGTIAVVHNGVIENHSELQRELESLGFVFESETDTEIVPHLLDYYLREGAEYDEAFNKTIRRLEGAFAILGYFGAEPDTIYAARKGSNPLLMGVRKNERFVGSMRSVIRNGGTDWIKPLDSNGMARLSSDEDKYRTWMLDGRTTHRPYEKDTSPVETANKGDFEHWMLKEIYDGPETVREALRGRVLPEKGIVRLGGIESQEIQDRLSDTDRMAIVACGTSYHAGLVGERIIEEVTGIPVETHLASEFQYRNEPLGRHTAVIGISQSGETADTIGALQKAKDRRLLTLGINNSPGSEMEAMTDAGVHCRAGKERSVASTKAFISQVTVLAEMALALSKEGSPLRQELMNELPQLPEKMERIIADKAAIEAIAKKYAHSKNFLFLGRGYEHISAMEGALKLKEISYIHAEAYSAGEMKHGPLALIDKDFPTFAIATDSPVYEKTLSNISEVKSRGGPVIALATEGNEAIRSKVDDVIYVPATLEQTQPILNAVAMQLFAYYVAVEKGLGPELDRPRNLAKSVTVE